MKICILGSQGMLGQEVSREFYKNKGFDTFLTYNSSFDADPTFEVRDDKLIKFNAEYDLKKLTQFNFDIIINCIGIVKPRIQNADDELTALKVNSIFPRQLLQQYLNKNTKIFQIATDCVFSGKDGSYTENSFHDADDIYGISKSLGEVKNQKFFNLRCSIIGREKKNKYSLLEWFLNSDTETYNGFINHYWNGLSTKAFAKYLSSIIKNEIQIPNLLHILPSNIISKFEILNLFNKKFFKSSKIIKPTNAEVAVDRSLKTNYQDLNTKIWSLTEYKKTPSVEDLIIDI